MEQPLVSVLTPVYNAEEYVREVLEAVQAQTYRNIEHIVVDDGSRDASAEVIEEFVARAEGDITFLQQDNAGEASTVNRAFSMSRGKYVVVVNADDPPYPELIAEAVRVLESDPALVVVYPDWEMIGAKGEVQRVVHTLEYSQQALVADCVCLPGPGAVIRSAALGGGELRNTAYRFVSDYELWLRLSLVGDMRRVPKVLARWRNHAGGATAQGRGVLLGNEFIRVIDDFFARDDLPSRVRAWRRQARAMAAYHAGLQRLHDQSVPGKRLMIRSLTSLFRRGDSYPTVRRSPLAVAAVLSAPVSVYLMRFVR